MANEAEAKTGATVLQFRPKKTKDLPGIKKVMPNADSGKRRVSQPAILVPLKERKGECAFKSSCRRECIEPIRSPFTDSIRQLLRVEAASCLNHVNALSEPGREEFEEKKKYVNELTWILEGSVVPIGGQKMRGTYSACGKALPGRTGLKPMEMFNNAQMREVVEGMELRLNLAGAYVSLIRGPVSGIHPDFAMLLTRMGNLRLPEDTYALETLMRDGGIHGIRTIARMAAEPTVPHGARMEYVRGMEKLLSCASAGPSDIVIINDYLARALSRFCPDEENLGSSEGTLISRVETGRGLPQMSSRVNTANLRKMLSIVIEESFQALINISGRLEEISSSSKETIRKNQGVAHSLYEGIKGMVAILAGKEMPNKELLAEFCERKISALRPGILDPGEQAIAKHLLRKMWAEDELDTDSVESLLRVLSAEDVDVGRYLEKLNLPNN